MYFQPETKTIFTDHSAIRHSLANVLFPDAITDDMLEYHGIVTLAGPAPAVAPGQVTERGAVAMVEGVWTMTWTVRAETEDENRARVPQKVTRRQGRQALLLAGKLDQVPLAIAAIEDETERRLAQIEWEDAQDYERQRPLVVLMGVALDLDLDALFIHADTL